VVHRDVKPANILLAEDGQPRLADFGIARLQDDRAGLGTEAGSALGTAAFMAPEQRLDASSVGPAADLYAAGAMLYTALCGGTPVDLFAAPPASPRWADIPDPLAAVIRTAVAFAPGERFADAAAFAAALEKAAAILPDAVLDRVGPAAPLTAPSPTVASAPAPVRRRPRRAGWIVAGVAAGLGLVAWLGRPPSPPPVVVSPPPAPAPVEVAPPPDPPKQQDFPSPWGTWTGAWNRVGTVTLELADARGQAGGTAVVAIGGSSVPIRVGGTWDPATGALRLRDRDSGAPEAGRWTLDAAGPDRLVGDFRAIHREQRFSLDLHRLTGPGPER
jgi:serine/threonine-protein kinase